MQSKKRKLIEILDDNLTIQILGEENREINNLHLDSRKIEDGDVYFAIKGYATDGHDYIESAIERGAKVIVCSDLGFDFSPDVTVVQVRDTRCSMAKAARNYYGNPSWDLKLIGVTGTNGKTTVVTLLWQLFTAMGYKVGLISTVENRIGNEVLKATHTTPNVIAINALLEKMVDSGCEFVFMEVSSHAIDQRRIENIRYTGSIFTNMSHDHLDYHKTFKEYIWAKKKFFDSLPSEAFAIVNTDDKRGEVMVQNTKAKIKSYALKSIADYKAKIIDNSVAGLQLLINGNEAHFRLVGEFNAYNLLAVYGTAIELGFDSIEILQYLSDITGADGRFENINVEGCSKIGIVDYAHTPDALENVLKTLAKVRSNHSNIITVMGCGGDRDVTKRPVMAQVVAKLSDRFIITSDNPRTENLDKILDDMEAGLSEEMKMKMLRIRDRKNAINTAVKLAEKNDIILVAGKGHEKYQDINGVKTPFDDKKVLREAMLENT
ncbi:MAG: UDP-N-acetylmuramoyl-L-alanyl-D-glutamate--2,6-diaminopimelate ligase [Saprospiraceae bacterium]